jgi:hypothetical protein
MERGTEEKLGKGERELRLVRPEVLLEDISPLLKDTEAVGSASRPTRAMA